MRRPKSANLDDAIRIADQTLLQQRIGLTSVYEIAKRLFEGPMHYSTLDLAGATALRFLKTRNFSKDKTVERAYMFGASLPAMHAFSLN
jgi:hypothetical protein